MYNALHIYIVSLNNKNKQEGNIKNDFKKNNNNNLICTIILVINIDLPLSMALK